MDALLWSSTLFSTVTLPLTLPFATSESAVMSPVTFDPPSMTTSVFAVVLPLSTQEIISILFPLTLPVTVPFMRMLPPASTSPSIVPLMSMCPSVVTLPCIVVTLEMTVTGYSFGTEGEASPISAANQAAQGPQGFYLVDSPYVGDEIVTGFAFDEDEQAAFAMDVGKVGTVFNGQVVRSGEGPSVNCMPGPLFGAPALILSWAICAEYSQYSLSLWRIG